MGNFEPLPQVVPGQPVRASDFNALVQAVRKRTPQSSPSVGVSFGQGAGFTLTSRYTRGGGSASGHPWQMSVSNASGGGSGKEVTVTAATINPDNVMPTMGGTALDEADPPSLSIDGDGTYRIYVTINVTLTFSSAGNLTDYEVDSATVQATSKGGSVPSDDHSAGTYYRQIGTIVDGVVTAQAMKYSLDVVALNKGELASEARLVATASG
jgi:hypothetical protein